MKETYARFAEFELSHVLLRIGLDRCHVVDESIDIGRKIKGPCLSEKSADSAPAQLNISARSE